MWPAASGVIFPNCQFAGWACKSRPTSELGQHTRRGPATPRKGLTGPVLGENWDRKSVNSRSA